MFINAGCWNEHKAIKFYDGNTVTKAVCLDNRNVIINDNLQEIAKKNGYTKAFFHNVYGLEFDDDVKIRNARKLNLEKNDVFSLKEYDMSEREDKKILYVPTKLEAQGTAKKMEDEKGYWLYDKTLVNHPIIASIDLWKKITEEQSNNLCKEWGGTRKGTKYTKKLDDGRYILMDNITVTFPSFSLLTYRETVKSDFGKKLETLSAAIKEKTGVTIHEYQMERLLKYFDITERVREA